MGEPYASQHDAYMQAYLASGKAKVLGTSRVVRLFLSGLCCWNEFRVKVHPLLRSEQLLVIGKHNGNC
jgi:hypothetical protein